MRGNYSRVIAELGRYNRTDLGSKNGHKMEVESGSVVILEYYAIQYIDYNSLLAIHK